jgi:uncharacterized protein YceK
MCVLHAVRCAALVAVVCVASGCATIMSRGPDHVSVTTNPAGATVFVGDQPVGQTPMVVTLDRKLEQAAFRLELPGFEPVILARGKRLNGWVWGNLMLGGLIGIVIDFSTGAARRFDDTPIEVGLKPSGGGAALPSPGLADADCLEKRHRIFVDAQDIQNRDDRMKMLRTAPVCK